MKEATVKSILGIRILNSIWFCGFIKDCSGNREFHLGNLAHT
jgi:hypothetical protein